MNTYNGNNNSKNITKGILLQTQRFVYIGAVSLWCSLKNEFGNLFLNWQTGLTINKKVEKITTAKRQMKEKCLKVSVDHVLVCSS